MTFVKEVYWATGKFPKDEVYGLSQQFRRAAVTVSSNLAEGHGRTSSREFHRFAGHARGSLLEVETQLEIASGLGYLDNSAASNLFAKASKIGKMLNGLLEWSRQAEDRQQTPDS